MAGNVKVCARFRPPNKFERKKGSKLVVKVTSDHIGVVVKDTENSHHSKGKTFSFDRVFDTDSTQEEVYKYSAYPLVEQVLKGYNVTMFAYGQTGSGKTYTMEGVPDSQGIIPRMVEHVFDTIMGEEMEMYQYFVRVSYVEIYNEKIRDLLEPANQDLRVREHRDKGVYIEDASMPYVGDPEEVLQLMAQGHLNRAVTSTGMNDTSSRSHAVFMLALEQKNVETDAKKKSKLMLVDLAGSEKVRKTGATGKVMKEAQNINRSLSCLGMVINCLTTGKSHIPYRDSKLTRLLSDSLGGNSKTCIIVTASPCVYNMEETISTMRFGTNCKRIKNKPKVNQELSVAEYKKIVASLERQISKLKEGNSILRSQVTALKQALLNGGSDIDIADLLKGAAKAAVGSEIDEVQQERLLETPAGSGEDFQHQILELEDQKDNLEDQLQDVKNELEIAESQRDSFRDEVAGLQRAYRDSEEARKKLANQTGQLKFYREKVEYMEKEHKLEIEDYQKRLREARRKIEESLGMTSEDFADDGGSDDLETLELEISSDQPVPYEMFEKFKQKQEEKYRHVIKRMKKQLDEAKNAEMVAKDKEEMAEMGHMSNNEQAETVHKLLTEKQEMRRQVSDLHESNQKYAQQMKAFTQREQYNDKLRRNWQTQLRQMEQALLLSNQINNQNRAKYQQTITEKDSEIAKLRAYVTHQLHRQRTMRRGNRIAKPISINKKSPAAGVKVIRKVIGGKRSAGSS